MKILIITEEDQFYLPQSIQYILKNCKYEILEIVCARNPFTPSLMSAAKKFYQIFGLISILQHGLRIMRAKLIDLFRDPAIDKTHYSIKKICQSFKIKYRIVDKVNAVNFLKHCQSLSPDLILSISPTQIFKQNLISIPTYGCINVHSSKLPYYRGLYPCYWAMAMGEKKIGVTVHKIENGIDTGAILLQRETEIPPNTTLDKMLSKTKTMGAQMILDVVEQIAYKKQVAGFYPTKNGSYFSFPTKESYHKFKNNGYKLW